ncbi:MAG TPA: MFS transporter [Vicinamibacterales bacterium]|nr:MFS transporter [Vicinamibacterales bacterium]
MASALTHRDFRIVWIAALGSTIGTWMQKFAQSWLVSDLTNSSAFYLSLDDFLSQLPIVLFMLIGGVMADRHDRRRLLAGSQYVQAIAAFVLAVLVYYDRVEVWHILMLSFIAGLGQAFGGPAYQSLLPSLVPRRDLPNAIALNSTQFNLSRLLGPMGGSVIVLWLGTAACFLLNSASFFIVVLALTMIRPPTPPATQVRKDILTELKGGLSHVRHNRLMLTLTILVFVSTFLSMPISTFLPIFAREVLTFEDPAAAIVKLSFLMAAQALGAIVGALLIGSLGRFAHMGRVMLGIQFTLGVLIVSFAMSSTPWLSYVLIFAAGIASMSLFSISFSIVQLAVPEELRGRVVSIYMVSLRGGWPLGSLVAGTLATMFPAPHVVALNGLMLSLFTVGVLISGRAKSLREL